ncbi:MAG: rhomboid family intramembrane serine protease [Acidobacteria bacterium]|nr:MAG: rhomboid family intramembrane serine protease [Acidobacteriota bacterium]
MFLPIGDSPNPPGKPWVTYGLIAVNVLVFLFLLPLSRQAPDVADPEFAAYVSTMVQEHGLDINQARLLVHTVTAYDLFTFRHGFKPGDPHLIDLLTSMFLHGGFLHLLGNILFLWIYGDNVEHRLGRMGYLLAYLATGAAACGGDALLRMDSLVPSVGASGAISGVLGLYFVWFPHNRVRVWIFLFPFIMNVVEFPARVVIGIFIVLQNILPALFAAGNSGVSHGAHLGGFVAGFGVAVALDRLVLARPEKAVRRRKKRGISFAPETRAAQHPPADVPDLDSGMTRSLAHGDWEKAAQLYFSLPRGQSRRTISADTKNRLGEELASRGHPRAALAAFQRALSDHPTGTHRARSHLGAAGVLMGEMGNPTGAYQHLYAALEEDPSASETTTARAMLTDLAGTVGSLPRRLPH